MDDGTDSLTASIGETESAGRTPDGDLSFPTMEGVGTSSKTAAMSSIEPKHVETTDGLEDDSDSEKTAEADGSDGDSEATDPLPAADGPDALDDNSSTQSAEPIEFVEPLEEFSGYSASQADTVSSTDISDDEIDADAGPPLTIRDFISYNVLPEDSDTQRGDDVLIWRPAEDSLVPIVPRAGIPALSPRHHRARVKWERLSEHFVRGGIVEKNTLVILLEAVKELLRGEPNVLELSSKELRVVGDIHGQFGDLLRAMCLGGDPTCLPYLFLGDYVDRGKFSLEVMCLIICLKLSTPTMVHMLRGNHECRYVSELYGFKTELLSKFGPTDGLALWQEFNLFFDTLPLAAVITVDVAPSAGARVFACHGGISKDLTLDMIRRADRFSEIPWNGIVTDLLWADPVPLSHHPSDAEQKRVQDLEYIPNLVRGISVNFGYKALKDFLQRNELTSLLRAHEVQEKGFSEHQSFSGQEHATWPSIITVFSAPNYCGKYHNKAAILQFLEEPHDGRMFRLQVYDETRTGKLLKVLRKSWREKEGKYKPHNDEEDRLSCVDPSDRPENRGVEDVMNLKAPTPSVQQQEHKEGETSSPTIRGLPLKATMQSSYRRATGVLRCMTELTHSPSIELLLKGLSSTSHVARHETDIVPSEKTIEMDEELPHDPSSPYFQNKFSFPPRGFPSKTTVCKARHMDDIIDSLCLHHHADKFGVVTFECMRTLPLLELEVKLRKSVKNKAVIESLLRCARILREPA